MRWKVHGRRTMYESDWVNVHLDDVELPDGTHLDHHVLTMPKASQTAVVLNEARSHMLLIWRHRFITDKWGWEVPAGWVESGEEPSESIAREVLEETGYRVRTVEPMAQYDAIPGISTMHFTIWLALGASQIEDPNGMEASDARWHSHDEVRRLVTDGLVSDGPSLTAICHYLAFPQDRVGFSGEPLRQA